MDKQQLIETYFYNTQGLQTTFADLYTDLALTALLAFILGRIYITFGNSPSNKKSFVGNFVLLSLTTMLIISIVKSSLTLSLGLVGALSIVRFRSAIKEPEELIYLFIAISIGIGFGASQRYLTLLAFIFICVIIVLKGVLEKKNRDEQNLYVTLSTNKETDIERIITTLKGYTTFLDLKRLDKNPDGTEMVLCARFDNLSKLKNAETSMRNLDEKIRISFLEDKGLFS